VLTYGDERAVLNLLYVYAELVDSGNFDGLSVLFAGVPVFMAGPDQPAVPGEMVGEVMHQFVKTYEGIPRTKHLVTNSILESDAPGQARTRSQFTVLQNVPGVLPLQVVASGRYHDEFTQNASGTWAFSQRIMLVDAYGDASAHLETGDAVS